MGLFDKVKKGLTEITGDLKNEVSKLSTSDVKGKLMDFKDVVSESYTSAVEKLEDKKELRVEVEKEFLSIRGQLLKDYSDIDLKNRDEILNLYLRKEIKSYKDLESANEVLYKGILYKNPSFTVDVSDVVKDEAEVVSSETKVTHEIDAVESKVELIEVEVVSSENKLSESNSVDIVESVETDTTIKVDNASENKNEVLTLEDLIQVKAPTVKSSKESDLLIDSDVITDSNVTSDDKNLENVDLRIIEKEKLLYEKIIKYIWEDVKKYAELYIFELSIPKKSLDTVSGNCEVCKNNFTYKEMKHRDYMICSDGCLNKTKKLIKDLNSGDIEVFLRKHNEKSLKEFSKEKIDLMLSSYNSIKLVDIESNSWELVGNSHVFKSVKPDGSELYINYKLVCEKDIDGVVKILLTTDSLNSTDSYLNLIKESKYANLELFKFLFVD